MTVQEFSDQFDVLYNNITSNQAPGLNEYEKSVFLTKAQDEIIKNYFSPKGNLKQDGFDDSPKRQADFSSIIENKVLLNINSIDKFDQRSIAYALPSDLFISLNEQLMSGTTPIVVVPLSYEEYNRVMAKPYKYPPKYQAWRLITKNATAAGDIIENSSTQAMVTYDSSEYYKGLELTATTRSTTKVKIEVFNSGQDAGQTAEDVVNNFSPEITTTSDLITIHIALPENVSLDNYYQWCIKDNTNVNDIVTFTWPSEPDSEWGNPRSTIPTDSPMWSFEVQAIRGAATIVEIIGRFAVTPTYRIRYVRKSKPIILTELYDIQNELTIDGEHEPMTSELPRELHEEILQRAVELAKVAWEGSSTLVTQAGQRSE